jgi:hypothetical protein
LQMGDLGDNDSFMLGLIEWLQTTLASKKQP